jgi:hypothetical protein
MCSDLSYRRIRLLMRVDMVDNRAEGGTDVPSGYTAGAGLLDGGGQGASSDHVPMGEAGAGEFGCAMPGPSVRSTGSALHRLLASPCGGEEPSACTASSSSPNDADDSQGVEALAAVPDSLLHAGADLSCLFAAAISTAESRHADALHDSEAWRLLRRLLSLLVDAQRPLLRAELARNEALRARRGQAARVQFACYDFAAMDPPPRRRALPSDGTSSSANTFEHDARRADGSAAGSKRAGGAVRGVGEDGEDGQDCRAQHGSKGESDIPEQDQLILQPLVRIVLLQKSLADCTSASDRSAAIHALCDGLAYAAEAHAAAAGDGDAHARAVRLRAASAAREVAAQLRVLGEEGRPMLADKLSQYLSSRIRFHLHSLFDTASGRGLAIGLGTDEDVEDDYEMEDLLLNGPACQAPVYRSILTLLPYETSQDAIAAAWRHGWPAKQPLSAAGAPPAPLGHMGGGDRSLAAAGSDSEDGEEESSSDSSEGGGSDEPACPSPPATSKSARASSARSGRTDPRSLRLDTAQQKTAECDRPSPPPPQLEPPGSPTASQLLRLPTGREDGLLGRQNTSLATLLSHALLLWQTHTPSITAPPLSNLLQLRDLCAEPPHPGPSQHYSPGPGPWLHAVWPALASVHTSRATRALVFTPALLPGLLRLPHLW